MGNSNGYNCTGVYNENEKKSYIGDYRPSDGNSAHTNCVNANNQDSTQCYGYSYDTSTGKIKGHNSNTLNPQHQSKGTTNGKTITDPKLKQDILEAHTSALSEQQD